MFSVDRRWLASLGPVVLLFVIWHVAVVATQSLIFPTPWQVAVGLVDLIRQGLLVKHVVASLFRVTYGYLLAAALAIPVGMLMGWFATAHTLLNPLVQGLRPISPIAWIPLAILWFGVGDLSPIFLIFLSSFFPMVVGTAAGVMTIDRKFLRAASNFEFTGFRLFRSVVLPAALPQIVTGMRIGLGVAWLVVVAAEMIAGELRPRVPDHRPIGVMGFLLDSLMRGLERLDEVRWRYET